MRTSLIVRNAWLRSTLLIGLMVSFTAYSGFFAGVAWGKTGSYGFFDTSLVGTMIRITAKAEDGTTYDETFSTALQTPTQARNTIRSDLAGAGWVVEDNGGNGITISGTDDGTGKVKSKISQVDCGDNQLGTRVSIDGNVKRVEGKGLVFKISFSPPNADSVEPGTLLYDLNTLQMSAPLSANDTPTQAAAKLETALINAGLIVTRTGTDIILDWANPTNTSLLPESELQIDLSLDNGAGGPHLGLGLPDTIVVPALSGQGLALFLLLGTGAVLVFRQMRSRRLNG